jgi:hypothetical protein
VNGGLIGLKGLRIGLTGVIIGWKGLKGRMTIE